MKNIHGVRYNNTKNKPVYKNDVNTTPLKRMVKKNGRNEPCSCGSGIKNKRCCNTK